MVEYITRLRCQTESRYVQTVPDGKCLCPDPPRWKVPMSRLSCVQYLSCVHKTLCPDYGAFKVAYVQIIVRSKLPMSRLSCVQSCLCPDFRAFIGVSRPCNFERTTPPMCGNFGRTYRLSVWDLKLVNFLRRMRRSCMIIVHLFTLINLIKIF